MNTTAKKDKIIGEDFMIASKLAGPLMISLDVTYKCNYRCLHCFNGSGENALADELTDEELRSVFQMIGRIQPTVVCFCGGEPTLRSDILMEGCKIISKLTCGNTTVNMVTNGSNISMNLAKRIKEAGFSVVQVSLDGAQKDSHEWLRNKEGSFESAISAITTLRQAGVEVGVAFTPNLKNLSEFEAAAQLCVELGVHEFRIQPLMPLGRAIQNLKEYMPSYRDYSMLSRKLQKMKYENLNGKTLFDWGDPVDHVLRFSSERFSFNPMIGINAYGGIYISPYIPVTFGNIKRHSLSDYWNSGLSDAWSLPFVQELSAKVYDIATLDLKSDDSNLPQIYYEESFDIDLVEEPALDIKTMTLKKLRERYFKKESIT